MDPAFAAGTFPGAGSWGNVRGRSSLSPDENQELGAAAAHTLMSVNSRYRAAAALRDGPNVLPLSNGCIGRRNTIDPVSAGAMLPACKVRNSWSAYEARMN